MSKQVQFRRGTYVESEAFTGAEGEITVDTDNNTLRVHNGVAQGGFPVTGNVHFTGNEMTLGESDLTITVNSDTSAESLVINGSTNEVHLHSANSNEALRLANHNASAYMLIEAGGATSTAKKINLRASFVDVYANLRFQQNGQGLVFKDQSAQQTGLQQKTPAASIGAAGDVAGMIAYDELYIYVCVADYDGTTPIWKRTTTGSTW
jgi:hypothetical protein